MPHTIMADVAR